MNTIDNLIARKPWLLIVAAFLLLIAAWSVLITLAVQNAPATVPLEQSACGTGILSVDAGADLPSPGRAGLRMMVESGRACNPWAGSPCHFS